MFICHGAAVPCLGIRCAPRCTYLLRDKNTRYIIRTPSCTRCAALRVPRAEVEGTRLVLLDAGVGRGVELREVVLVHVVDEAADEGRGEIGLDGRRPFGSSARVEVEGRIAVHEAVVCQTRLGRVPPL